MHAPGSVFVERRPEGLAKSAGMIGTASANSAARSVAKETTNFPKAKTDFPQANLPSTEDDQLISVDDHAADAVA
jgi:hypothetical protein